MAHRTPLLLLSVLCSLLTGACFDPEPADDLDLADDVAPRSSHHGIHGGQYWDWLTECKPDTDAACCVDNSDCDDPDKAKGPSAYYCQKPAGACDGAGTCQPRPEACTQQYDPVLGCDDEEYGNACEAAAAGVNVAC